MEKRFLFLHDFKFPIETLRNLYIQVVALCLEDSKYKEIVEDLLTDLVEIIAPIFKKHKNLKAPLISVILRNAYNYCQLLDQHPNKLSITKILFPAMAESLETALDAYIVAVESKYEYNHYCANSINYRLSNYREKLSDTVKIYNSIVDEQPQ